MITTRANALDEIAKVRTVKSSENRKEIIKVTRIIRLIASFFPNRFSRHPVSQ